MEIPTHLKHKPLIKVENYGKIDGEDAGCSDAKGLSIGIAQWNKEGSYELSAKVWRYTGEKWSRQSEELPLHRVIDLAALIVSTLHYAEKGVLLSDEKFNITTSQDSQKIEQLKQSLLEDKEHLKKSLNRLVKVLKELELVDC